MVSQFLKASILIVIFHSFLMILEVDSVMVFYCAFLAEGVPIPSMILIRFSSFCGSPSRSENLRRSAFYTINTMVFAQSAFSENLFFQFYFLDFITSFAMLLCVAFN